MEKILRKVSTKDRNPEDYKYYYSELGEILFDSTKRWLDRSGKIVYPEYWYEEVSVEELVSYTDPIVVKRVIEVNNKFAKERYEKALCFANDETWFYKDKEVMDKQDILKALKIAAGMKNNFRL